MAHWSSVLPISVFFFSAVQALAVYLIFLFEFFLLFPDFIQCSLHLQLIFLP